MLTRHLLIRGHVQGVGFRYRLQTEAARAGVTGWVRNRIDGRVEAVIQGSPEQLRGVLAWARRGPLAARVDEVIESDAEGDLAVPYTRFEQRPTA